MFMKLKKKYCFIYGVSIIFITSILLNFYLYFFNKKYQSDIIDINKNISKTYNYLNSITIENFEKKVLSGEEFYIYIGRPDCNDCLLFEPIFEEIIQKYNLSEKIIYLNVKTLVETDLNKWNNFKNKYGFTQTPAIIHFKDKDNIDIIEWDNENGLEADRLLDWLKNMNLIDSK